MAASLTGDTRDAYHGGRVVTVQFAGLDYLWFSLNVLLRNRNSAELLLAARYLDPALGRGPL